MKQLAVFAILAMIMIPQKIPIKNHCKKEIFNQISLNVLIDSCLFVSWETNRDKFLKITNHKIEYY